MTEEKRRGRPEHEPTEETRLKVRVLKAGAMSQLAIAEAIGISEPTLRKHYSSELDQGGAIVTAEVLMARYRAAMGGSVPAQNKLLELAGTLPPNKMGRPPSTKAEPALGKKAEAELAAQDAHEGTGWADLVKH